MEKVTVFLGGTCAKSTWREELISKLDSERIETFNPVKTVNDLLRPTHQG